jgi:DNA-binding response OmpR family regulator
MKALRVLVVEDDALIAMLLGEMFPSMGHDVCATAATEAEAVSAATRYHPDLMIVDAGLGRGSGVSAMEEILRAGLSRMYSSVGVLRHLWDDKVRTLQTGFNGTATERIGLSTVHK